MLGPRYNLLFALSLLFLGMLDGAAPSSLPTKLVQVRLVELVIFRLILALIHCLDLLYS